MFVYLLAVCRAFLKQEAGLRHMSQKMSLHFGQLSLFSQSLEYSRSTKSPVK